MKSNRGDLDFVKMNKLLSIEDRFKNAGYLTRRIDKIRGLYHVVMVRVDGNKRHIVDELQDYCTQREMKIELADARKLYFTNMIASPMTPEEDEGEEQVQSDQADQMIVIDHLASERIENIYRRTLDPITLDMNGRFYFDELPEAALYVFLIDEKPPKGNHPHIFKIDGRLFQDRVKAHLTNYRVDVLKIQEPGIFPYRGEDIERGHILPKNETNDLLKNILPPYVRQAKETIDEVGTHRYFHHLNSSQALCMNFFLPLIEGDHLHSLVRILFPDSREEKAVEWAFEKESDLEREWSSSRVTNFDFFIRTDQGRKIYFEIKYTERGFGQAQRKTDEQKSKYNRKFREVYHQPLKDHPAITEVYKEKEAFYDHYQLLRNLIHIDNQSYVVALYPEDNHDVRQQVKIAKETMIQSPWTDHFIPITWEDLLFAAQSDIHIGFQSKLANYYEGSFTEKYFPWRRLSFLD